MNIFNPMQKLKLASAITLAFGLSVASLPMAHADDSHLQVAVDIVTSNTRYLEPYPQVIDAEIVNGRVADKCNGDSPGCTSDVWIEVWLQDKNTYEHRALRYDVKVHLQVIRLGGFFGANYPFQAHDATGGVSSTPITLTIPKGWNGIHLPSAVKRIPLAFDRIPESNGEIRVFTKEVVAVGKGRLFRGPTIENSTNSKHQYYTQYDPQAKLEIIDDDPVFSVRPVHEAVVAGEDAVFELVGTKQAPANHKVEVWYKWTEGILDHGSRYNWFNVAAGSGILQNGKYVFNTFNVGSKANDDPGGDSFISAYVKEVILSHSWYSPRRALVAGEGENNAASVTITDDDLVPEFSLKTTASFGKIREGEIAPFVLSASKLPDEAMTVKVQYTIDFGATESSPHVPFQTGRTVVCAIPTIAGSMNGPPSSNDAANVCGAKLDVQTVNTPESHNPTLITATIIQVAYDQPRTVQNWPKRYGLDPTDSASVFIDDISSGTRPGSLVADDPNAKPLIWMTSAQSSVPEGNDIGYTIHASRALSEDYTVRVEILEDWAQHIAGEYQRLYTDAGRSKATSSAYGVVQEVIIKANTTGTYGTVKTVADETYEDHAEVYIRLQPKRTNRDTSDLDYDLHPTLEHQIVVVVYDDDGDDIPAYGQPGFVWTPDFLPEQYYWNNCPYYKDKPARGKKKCGEVSEEKTADTLVSFASDRIASAFAGESTLDVQSLVAEFGSSINVGHNLADLVNLPNFALPLASSDGFVGPITLWGGNSKNSFSLSNVELNVGQLGMDTVIADSYLLGMSMAALETSRSTDINETMDMVQPYVAYQPIDTDLHLSIVTGFGRGELSMDKFGVFETARTFAQVGVDGKLVSYGSSSLDLAGDFGVSKHTVMAMGPYKGWNTLSRNASLAVVSNHSIATPLGEFNPTIWTGIDDISDMGGGFSLSNSTGLDAGVWFNGESIDSNEDLSIDVKFGFDAAADTTISPSVSFTSANDVTRHQFGLEIASGELLIGGTFADANRIEIDGSISW